MYLKKMPNPLEMTRKIKTPYAATSHYIFVIEYSKFI